MQIINVRPGMKIDRFGVVSRVQVFTNQVAVKGATPGKTKGSKFSAHVVAEAEAQCYEEVPSSVRVTNNRGQVREFKPHDEVSEAA